MSMNILIKTSWTNTGRLRLRAGWFGPVTEAEQSRRLGYTGAPRCGIEKVWTDEQTRWVRARNKDLRAREIAP